MRKKGAKTGLATHRHNNQSKTQQKVHNANEKRVSNSNSPQTTNRNTKVGKNGTGTGAYVKSNIAVVFRMRLCISQG